VEQQSPVISGVTDGGQGGDAMSICNEHNASQHHNAQINHFRIRTFSRKQV